MKKVGIVTFHTALNYGAIMQTYALQTFLNSIGIENTVIDYRSDFIQKCYRPFFISDGKVFNAIVRGICFGKNIRKRKKGFAEFTNKYLCCSKPYFTSDEIKADRDEYSFYISGSDQVWSPISAGFDPVYFLPFARDEQKLSYAASIGLTELNTDIKKELFSRLKGFQVLSVREESAKKLLMDADTNREIYVHPDPTLLIPREQWLKIASDPVVKEKYVLVFNVEKPIHDITYAKKLATEKNMKVVYLNDRTIRKDPDITYIEAPSPDEFLSLFANASAIVTNSFHGTVFSIIFQKEFYVELDNRKQRNIRVESLLTQLEIPTRSISEAQSATEINWDNVERILRGKRENVERYFNAMFGQKNKHE